MLALHGGYSSVRFRPRRFGGSATVGPSLDPRRFFRMTPRGIHRRGSFAHDLEAAGWISSLLGPLTAVGVAARATALGVTNHGIRLCDGRERLSLRWRHRGAV